MTLLLFSFRHTFFLTVHTDLHGHTASGCLWRSRPLQWCLIYLSRLSGCPKSSQRDAPSSGISLFVTNSNQQVLNLANTEGGRAQSLFIGPKTAWRLSRCGTGRFRAKGTSHQIHTLRGVIHKESVPEGETINSVYYKGVMERLLNRIRRVRLGMCESGGWFLLYSSATPHNATIVKQFLAQRKSDCARPPSVFARLSTCWLLFVPKSEIPLEGSSLWLDFGHPESRDKYIKHHCKGRLLQRHPEAVWPCKSVCAVRKEVCRKL